MDKEAILLEAAIDVFSRYGFRRARMADIADAAGVSRQTLYASYASKDDIQSAAYQYMIEQMIEAIKRDWNDKSEIGDRIDVYFKHAIVAHFEKLRQMPDAADLLNKLEGEGQRDLPNRTTKHALLATLFVDHEKALKNAGTSAADLADFLIHSSSSFLISAHDEDHLRQLLRSLKSAVLAQLQTA